MSDSGGEPGDETVIHPRIAPRRSATVRSWWGKAVTRAVEESAYSDSDLRRGRALARQGAVGALGVGPGRVVAAVETVDDTVTVQVELPVMDEESTSTLAEVVASTSGWIGALMHGDLPRALVEASEETGVELLPYGGEFTSTCGCEAWADPCPHALAVLTQWTWLVDSDPFVLTGLRGLGREELLARLSDLAGTGTPGVREVGGSAWDDEEDQDHPEDLVVALEAAERAALMLTEYGPSVEAEAVQKPAPAKRR